MAKKQFDVNVNELFLYRVHNKVILKEIGIPMIVNALLHLTDLTI